MNERLEEIKEHLHHIRSVLGIVGDQQTVNRAGELEELIIQQVEHLEETVKRNKELEYASKYNGELNEFLQKRKLPPNTLGRHVVDVVMEHVEKLEKDIGNYKKACSALETLESYSRKESQRYRQALEFYADDNNHHEPISLRQTDGTPIYDNSKVHEDGGLKAREALTGEPNE